MTTPTAFLVGVEEPLATTCHETLSRGGLRVLRVGHVAAACERLPVVMPQLVVSSTTLHAGESETLADRCVAVGAELIQLAPDTLADAELEALLKPAARTALLRSLGRGA